ncbi:MAG TPA: carboxylating nicotinate-nucleotide diphosphorylase [Symbiobacteriaceae bacterium]|jgi:nicotinate-nucleotide pyrophosphorylase (carboxylating)|nr:carboxylating nicotinate-nucleotide diphosphorylase [Symbiobacteriaceae bacterium]
MTLNPIAVDEIVRRALLEDIGAGDITTEATVPADKLATAVLLVKEEGVLCGQSVAQAVFRTYDPSLTYEVLVPEGSKVVAGTEVARISGNARSILTAERVALNFLQRMSGIASITRRLSDSIKYYHARLVETRKTTPGLRILEKYAVRVGGGLNHRYGLHDAILIKDNHIAVAGGVRQAIVAARKVASHTSRVEVEVDTLEQLQEALEGGADIILLDNMDPDTMRKAVEMTAGKATLEASGGITAANLEEVARTGVDIISMGALTHSVKSLDISLDIILS